MALEDRSGRINRDSPVSIPHQVAADMRGLITDGDLRGRMPSEQELAAQYGVSRVTIRSGIAQLAEDDLVRVVHGRGSFARPPEGWQPERDSDS